ncbi:hypothetical protein [Nocardia sp. NPDC050412]|uniref:hypothetical protein n=1 Tax=unclassified Nocardia TaxID=2637762 RepID=UPI00379DC5D0
MSGEFLEVAEASGILFGCVRADDSGQFVAREVAAPSDGVQRGELGLEGVAEARVPQSGSDFGRAARNWQGEGTQRWPPPAATTGSASKTYRGWDLHIYY